MTDRFHPPTRPPNAEGQAQRPWFLLRPEHWEGPFLAAHAEQLDGAVLLSRHLGPHAPDSRQHRDGLRGDELAAQARQSRIPHVHDPETTLLPLLQGDGTDQAFARIALTAAARSVPARLTPEDLEPDEALRDLTVAVLAPQASVVCRAPPYFRFGALDDPWLTVSLRAAQMTQQLTRRAPLATFIQTDLDGLNSGTLAHAADLYAQALNPRGIAFLQVAGLDTEHADPIELLAYLNAVRAWVAHGFTVIADKVGRFGTAAVAMGAAGMACGTRMYRSTPDIHIETPFLRGGKLRYWAPVRHDRLHIDDATAREARGALAPCPVADCQALKADATLEQVRLHNIHLSIHELAQLDADTLTNELLASPISYVRGWGQALALARRRRAQA